MARITLKSQLSLNCTVLIGLLSVCPSMNTSISVCLFKTSANFPSASSPRLSKRALPDWNSNLSDIATYTFPSFSRTVSSSLLNPNSASFTLLNSCCTFSFCALIICCSSLMVRSLSFSSFFFWFNKAFSFSCSVMFTFSML